MSKFLKEKWSKTPHRIMYEVLSADNYKKFCRNLDKEGSIREVLECSEPAAHDILGWAFIWHSTPEGEYHWESLFDELEKNTV